MIEKFKRVFEKAIDNKETIFSDQHSLFRKSITFQNKTDETIITLDRNNIPVVYKPNPNRYKSEQVFIIKTSYQFLGRDMTLETLLRLHEFGKRFKIQDENHTLLYNIIQQSYDANPNGSVHHIVVERQITLDDLKRYKAIYEEGTDVMLFNAEGWLSTPHPYSAEGRSMANHDQYVEGKKISGCLIEVVDNDNKVGNRYVYCAKQLIKLKPIVDKTRQSGVYYTQFQNSDHEADQVDPHFMDFDSAEEQLGMFKTEEEAITGGSPDLLAKKKAMEAQAELEKLRMEAAEVQAINKKREAYFESELQSLKNANMRLKEEAAQAQIEREERDRQRKEEYAEREDKRKDRASQRSDYYEERSTFRKDSSDMFKWIPTLLVGAMGILAFFLK